MNGLEIYVLGLNHETAPIGVREKATFSLQEIPTMLENLKKTRSLNEALILSTCNRTEIYAVAEKWSGARKSLEKFLTTSRQEFREEDLELLYFYEGQEAVQHLFRVASGLNSMILGEPQILGQVKEAFSIALEAGSTSVILNRLFNWAIQTGKRVRSETALGAGAVSVASAAVELAQKIFGELGDHHVLLIGAGETGGLTAHHLKEKGAGTLYITNRTFQKAKKLANRLGGIAHPFSSFEELLPEVDLVIGSTSSQTYVLTRNHIHKILPQRQSRPLFLIDIAVPRDFDPDINKLGNIFLYDIDALQQIVDQNLAKRRQEIYAAQNIVLEEVGKFLEWRKSLQLTPTIVALREKLESIRERELKKYSHRVSPEEYEKMKMVTHGMLNKILHLPITQLKRYNNGNPDGLMRIDIVREIFDLENENE